MRAGGNLDFLCAHARSCQKDILVWSTKLIHMLRAGASRAIGRLASITHVVMTALLTFLFPEWYEQNERYRPERHYMRGPGPKWRAKHGM
jgi:hypothetical protein